MSKKNLLWVFFLIIFFAIFFLISFVCFPEHSYEIAIKDRFLEPTAQHWLGTDQLGRDFFSLLVVGTRNSFFFASLSLLIGSLVGTTFAFLALQTSSARYFLEATNKIVFAMPIILTAILIYAFYNSSWASLLAISLFNIPIFYYLTKNIVNRILVKEYALFSISIGNNNWNIYRLHIFPQLYNSWIVQFSIQWGIALLMEAGLSYLGLGIQQPTPSLGRMLFENRSFYEIKAGLVFYPGLVLFTLVFLFQYCSDSLHLAKEKHLN